MGSVVNFTYLWLNCGDEIASFYRFTLVSCAADKIAFYESGLSL